jgi:predicted nucleic acid-binding protein
MSIWILDTDHLSLLQRENVQLIEGLVLHQQERVVITIVTAEEQLRGRLSVISKSSDRNSKISIAIFKSIDTETNNEVDRIQNRIQRVLARVKNYAQSFIC